MKRSTRKERLGWSEKEVESLLAHGLVNQWLADEHLSLLKSLHKRAKKFLAPFGDGQLRAIGATKLREPDRSLLDIAAEVKAEGEAHEVPQ